MPPALDHLGINRTKWWRWHARRWAWHRHPAAVAAAAAAAVPAVAAAAATPSTLPRRTCRCAGFSYMLSWHFRCVGHTDLLRACALGCLGVTNGCNAWVQPAASARCCAQCKIPTPPFPGLPRRPSWMSCAQRLPTAAPCCSRLKPRSRRRQRPQQQRRAAASGSTSNGWECCQRAGALRSSQR